RAPTPPALLRPGPPTLTVLKLRPRPPTTAQEVFVVTTESETVIGFLREEIKEFRAASGSTGSMEG
ncbi:MAG: hypothetical protein ACRDIY_08580, partial [Chloroflexota bacterium]